MNKHYAITDLHGMGKLWDQIKEYCDETDTIYFLGDAADRGPDGLRVMRELFQDKRVVYIKGNHEGIMENVAPGLIDGYTYDINLWLMNGGKPTIDAFKSLSEPSQCWYIRKIRSLPDVALYTNPKGQTIILSHAGIDPDDMDNKQPNRYGESPWQWDRDHFYSKWNPDPKYNNTYIVHGHTPVPHVIAKLNEMDRFMDRPPRYTSWDYKILNYADGHKFDLDLASFQTERVALFDLDELKVEKYFYDLGVDEKNGQ